MLAAWSLAGRPAHAAPAPAKVEYNKHVRPILSNTCFKCHGPDVRNNQSDLRLDLPEIATALRTNKAGRVSTPIVPGQPDQSELIRRVTANDPAVAMPPPDSLHQLNDTDRAILRRWIAQGAVYQQHWAFTPPAKAAAPPLRDAAGARNPIDHFVGAVLEERGLAPAPEADRRTLIRRLALDLTGLPPAPAEVAAFVDDPRPDAYERLVDRLLASPHYGERMAVPWLDAVRFADTVGFHGDQRQNNFPYRDYVIDAFNRNLPYDRFVREQLAGDLLPGATDRERVASGFNRLNMMTREGGAQPDEYLAKYAADRVRTVSTAFLGATMGCAECHDHKFDPFKTRDFYAMAAYFADVKQWGVYHSYDYTPEPELKGFSNEHPFPPEIEVENPYLQRRQARLRGQLERRAATAAAKVLASTEGVEAVARWAAKVAPVLAENPAGWRVVPAESTRAERMAIEPDGSVRLTAQPKENQDKVKREQAAAAAKPAETAAGAPPPERAPPPGETKPDESKRDKFVILAEIPVPAAALRIEVFWDEEAKQRDDGIRMSWEVEFVVETEGGEEARRPSIAGVFPNPGARSYSNGYYLAVLDPPDRVGGRVGGELDYAVWQFAEPLELAAGERLVVKTNLDREFGGRIRFAVTPLGLRLPGEPPAAETLAAFAAASPTPRQQELLAAEYFRTTGAPDRDAFREALRELREIAECRGGRAYTTVTVAAEPRVTRVLPRGNWQDQSGEIVAPAPPAFLAGSFASPTGGRRATRLDLADWITAPSNPLTARAFANRLWSLYFGTGLSAVLDDLGKQGEYPSHPELLDWLAVTFVESGWDVKALVRTIVTSGTYRRSSVRAGGAAEADPANRLLARQNPRRLEAEFVRDLALGAAGLIDSEIGGPSALPYQPAGYYDQLNFPLRTYVPQIDERQYRRGLYVHWQRTFLHPMLANFDAPSREECVAQRTVSNTPQQALSLLNDPTFVEAARALAEHVLRECPGADVAAMLDCAFARVLARPPAPGEIESLGRFLAAQLEHYAGAPEEARQLAAVGLQPADGAVDRVKLAAWTQVCRVLLNLNEAIVRY